MSGEDFSNWPDSLDDIPEPSDDKEECPYCSKSYKNLKNHLKKCPKNPNKTPERSLSSKGSEEVPNGGDNEVSQPQEAGSNPAGGIPIQIKSDIIFFIQKYETQYQSQGLPQNATDRMERLLKWLFGGG